MNKRDRNKYPTIGEMADDIECNQCTYPGVMIKQAVSEFTALLQRQQSDEGLIRELVEALEFYGNGQHGGDGVKARITIKRANTRLKEGRNA